MDALVRESMKDAAECDRQCELQNSVSHQISEHMLYRKEILLPVCMHLRQLYQKHGTQYLPPISDPHQV